MIFTGDIEAKAEQHLVDSYKETGVLNSTILKIPHHVGLRQVQSKVF